LHESVDQIEKQMRYDKEARSILKRISGEGVPEVRFLVRLQNLME